MPNNDRDEQQVCKRFFWHRFVIVGAVIFYPNCESTN